MDKNAINAELIRLYEEMSNLTKGECAQCAVPHNCCNRDACEMTQHMAKELWGVDLKPGPGKIPFLGPNGCTVEPHLRPFCTFHTCAINSLGFKPNDDEWTEKYFKLRQQIDELEAEKHS